MTKVFSVKGKDGKYRSVANRKEGQYGPSWGLNLELLAQMVDAHKAGKLDKWVNIYEKEFEDEPTKQEPKRAGFTQQAGDAVPDFGDPPPPGSEDDYGNSGPF
jgi:hypothetical protein